MAEQRWRWWRGIDTELSLGGELCVARRVDAALIKVGKVNEEYIFTSETPIPSTGQ